MSNSWKAICVESKYSDCNDWKVGDEIEVLNGVALSNNCHGFGGERYKFLQTFELWSKQQSSSKWELIEPTEQSDAINPSHYKNQCSLECIDAMLMAFGADHVYMYCCITAWKYMWRYENKNGIEDIGKARWYIEKAKELGHDQPEVWNLNYVLEKIEKVKGIPLC